MKISVNINNETPKHNQVKSNKNKILDEKDAQNAEITFLSDEELAEAVDSAFEIFDDDNDGLISYYEYKHHNAQKAAENNQEEIKTVPVTTLPPKTVKHKQTTAKPTRRRS